MSIKIKAGTSFVLPVEIQDANFSKISRIEFLFTQTERGETLKTALWVRDGASRDASLEDSEDSQKILILFTREDTYLFKQDEMFFMDTRIHYDDSETNPCTNIVMLRMRNTLFKAEEEVTE